MLQRPMLNLIHKLCSFNHVFGMPQVDAFWAFAGGASSKALPGRLGGPGRAALAWADRPSLLKSIVDMAWVHQAARSGHEAHDTCLRSSALNKSQLTSRTSAHGHVNASFSKFIKILVMLWNGVPATEVGMSQ